MHRLVYLCDMYLWDKDDGSTAKRHMFVLVRWNQLWPVRPLRFSLLTWLWLAVGWATNVYVFQKNVWYRAVCWFNHCGDHTLMTFQYTGWILVMSIQVRTNPANKPPRPSHEPGSAGDSNVGPGSAGRTCQRRYGLKWCCASACWFDH
jgi:hypothetical protein